MTTPADLIARARALLDQAAALLAPAPPQPRDAFADILAAVSAETGISPADILGRCRRAEIVRARQLLCSHAHGAGMSLTEIGRRLGRDHGTIAWAIRAVQS